MNDVITFVVRRFSFGILFAGEGMSEIVGVGNQTHLLSLSTVTIRSQTSPRAVHAMMETAHTLDTPTMSLFWAIQRAGAVREAERVLQHRLIMNSMGLG